MQNAMINQKLIIVAYMLIYVYILKLVFELQFWNYNPIKCAYSIVEV